MPAKKYRFRPCKHIAVWILKEKATGRETPVDILQLEKGVDVEGEEISERGGSFTTPYSSLSVGRKRRYGCNE
ncbi:hypothetical protein J6590_051953 [Homalodisca vitripennis]|nr:hypothetical protein J6590_051953 [Homalodisca vitripennis]